MIKVGLEDSWWKGVTNGLTNGLTDQLMDNAISRVAFANENCHQVLGSQKLKLTPLETYVYMYYIVIEFGAKCPHCM